MIFVTIGTQAPFDRLISAMDEVAGLIGGEEVIAQAIGTSIVPKNMKVFDFIPPDEFDKLFAKARIIIGHAGTGTILSALTSQKPILVMPRIASLGEHRNEHQLATAEAFEKLGYIKVAMNEEELKQMSLELINNKDNVKLETVGLVASDKLVQSIRSFIQSND